MDPQPARPPYPVPFPVAVIGAGALGLTFAAGLARHMPVALIARTAARAAALRGGIQVGAAVNCSEIYCADAFAPDALPAADWAIVLVKAHDTEAAGRCARALMPRGVLSLQNGLIEDTLRRACAPVAAIQGVTTQGGYIEYQHEVQRMGERVVPVGAGETLVGPGFEPLAELLNRAGFRTRVVANLQAARMEKLLVSLVINPLTAVHRVPNGAVGEMPLKAAAEQLVREAWPVLRAEGLQLTADEALAKVMAVAMGTAANRSSMLQDVLAGRRTEIDHITGAFITIAERHGAEVPTHRTLLAQIKRMEAAPS